MTARTAIAAGSTRRRACLLAAVSAAAALFPAVTQADLIFQATPGDFNPATGQLASDVGPTGSLAAGSSSAVTIVSNATPNGLPAFNFNGTDGFQLNSALTSNNNQYTIFAVVLPNSSGTPESIVAGDRGSLQYRIDENTSVNPVTQAVLNRAEFQYGNANTPVSTSAFSLIDLDTTPTVPQPDAVVFGQNGVVVGDPGGSGFNIGGITRFGAAQSGTSDGEAFNGEIAEVQVYNNALTTVARQQIEGQLATKFGMSSTVVFSTYYNWTGGTGDIGTGTNWDQGSAPNSTTSLQATISNGGTATVTSSDAFNAYDVNVGDVVNLASATGPTNGTVIQTAGYFTVGGDLTVGNGGGTGVYNMSGGAINVANLYVGGGNGGFTAAATGTGTFIQTGGDVTATSGAEIGHNDGIGIYTMTGGTFEYNGGNEFAVRGYGATPSVLNIGGTAVMTVSNGTFLVGDPASLSSGGTGILNVTGGLLTNYAPGTTPGSAGPEFWVGNNGATGIVNISAGSISVDNWFRVGRGGGTGIVNLSGTGSITEINVNGDSDFDLGAAGSGTGTLNQSGGSLTTNGLFIFLGEFGGNTGVWNMSGGTATNNQQILVGYRGNGTLNVSGTAQINESGIVIVGAVGGSTGVLNLNGGTITTSGVVPGSGAATVNLNGGILQANSNTNLLPAFPNGVVNALAGNAIIDTNNNNVTITSSIGSPTGVTGGLTKIGQGTLQLGVYNTYSGTTRITLGTLQLLSVSGGTPVTIPNGTFQTPQVGYQYNPAGASWTFDAANAGITNGTGFNFPGSPPVGNQAGFIQRGGFISQVINFPQTGTYTLTFDTAQRSGGNDSYQTLETLVDGVSLDGTSLPGGGFNPGGNWGQSTYTIVESAGNHTIEFLGLDDQGNTDANGNPINSGGDNTAFVTDVALNGAFSSATPFIPATSPVVISDNATLDLNGDIQPIGSLAGTPLATVLLENGTLITGNGTTAATSTVFQGNISDSGQVGSLIKVGAGTLTLSGNNTYTGGTTVNGGKLVLASPGALPAFYPLSVGSGATVTVSNYSTGATRNSIFVSTLTIAGTTGAWTGKIDLGNNDLDVRTGVLGTVFNQISQGYANGSWQGSGGITSSAAAANTAHLTALGVIQNADSHGNQIYSQFDGQNVYSTDILVKYTYFGDANLDGKVDGSDYSLIDAGYASNRPGFAGTVLTGWYNGDFNYDGTIDGTDYALLDNAYNNQGGVFAGSSALVATATAQVAVAPAAVPEPATLSAIVVGVAALSRRGGRRRHA